MMLKGKIYNHCLRVLDEKISSIRSTMNDLRDSASNETKSTAGDKHETALAMLQIEQKNVAAQLENINAQLQTLKRLRDVSASSQTINGSLIETDKGYFYLSIPLGKIRVEEMPVTVLSAQSPLGKSFLGSGAGQGVTFNGTTYKILSVN